MQDATSRSPWDRRGLFRSAQAVVRSECHTTLVPRTVAYRSVSRIALGRLERAPTGRPNVECRGIGKLNAFYISLPAFCFLLPHSEDARGYYSLDLHKAGHRLIQSRCTMENNQVMRENTRCFLDK